MRNILGLAIALCALPRLASADHVKLEALSKQTVMAASQLYTDARRVIGNYPTYRQRYAFEHISFLHNSAHRFEGVLHQYEARDHQHDQLIRRAFQRLEHDAYYARSTFDDLFYGYDHIDYDHLDRLLTSIEYNIEELGHHLP